MRKNKATKGKKNMKRRYTRRAKRGGGGNEEDIQSSIKNLQEQIEFINTHSEDFSKIGMDPTEFVGLLQNVSGYIQSHNGELPDDMKPFGLGSVDLLRSQISQINQEIQQQDVTL